MSYFAAARDLTDQLASSTDCLFNELESMPNIESSRIWELAIEVKEIEMQARSLGIVLRAWAKDGE